MTEANAAIGHSPSLLAQLATIETEIAKLDDRLTEMNQPRDLAVSLEDLREVLHGRAAEIGALLRGDAEVARQAWSRHSCRGMAEDMANGIFPGKRVVQWNWTLTGTQQIKDACALI